MMTLGSRLLVSTWLFASAFLLPHTTATAWNALIVASLMAAVAFLAFAMPGRPGMRWWLAVLATWLMVSTMLLPYAAIGTLFHDVAVAMVMAALAFAPTAGWLARWREEHAASAAH